MLNCLKLGSNMATAYAQNKLSPTEQAIIWSKVKVGWKLANLIQFLLHYLILYGILWFIYNKKLINIDELWSSCVFFGVIRETALLHSLWSIQSQ